MADIFRGQGCAIVRTLALLLATVLASPAALAQLSEQPMLIVEPGMHTAPITSVAVDAAGRLAVTGSDDKTVRVWSLTDGKLLQTIRMPAGPGNTGKIYALTISPDGVLVAAGGWTRWPTEGRDESIFLFEAHTGKMTARIAGLYATTHSLAFSSDGRYLAAGLGVDSGLRVYDRDRQWAEVFRDTDYGAAMYGATFAADGRLATASWDGKIRLYNRDFKPLAPPKNVTGRRPHRIAFNPDASMLAIGYADVATVDLLDGRSLANLTRPNVVGLTYGSLSYVTWSKDGQTLYAGGRYRDGSGAIALLAWPNAGRGERLALPAGNDSISGLGALPDGAVLVATAEPLLAVLEPDGQRRWTQHLPKVDPRKQHGTLAVSADGAIVDFGFEFGGKSPLRFDLRSLKLIRDPPTDHQTMRPKQDGLAVEQWLNNRSPTLDGKRIKLKAYESSRSLAIHPDGSRFVLGAEWSLQAISANGEPLWRWGVPGIVWAVNITGNGRLVVAAYADGTIRWHRMDDGRELLALFVLADKQNWVAWTPEGFYGATAGAFGVLQWQVNRGFDAAADTVPVHAIPRLRRPDALALVLQELETARALGIADLKAARRDVQIATGSKKAPGARLHVLTIGVSDYGDKAKDLRLKFAHRDAQDVASALVNTQEGGLYAEVKPQFLLDRNADKAGIFEALAATERNMGAGVGHDLAVVMFSGHGTMIDGQFYLVPHGADNGTSARLKATAISAGDFQSEVAKLAQHGRVLVLLDACRSAGLIGRALPAADLLKAVLAASNVTVLTSSTADKLSREDEKWQHGAFTKILLDALSGSAHDIDADHNGVITMAELTAYIAKHLSHLTGGEQQLGLDQRFQGDIFVAGL
jgi:Caspase domain/WD domain, G-beta repeat